jgi:hypothetical protein
MTTIVCLILTTSAFSYEQVLFIDRLIIKDKKANQKRLEKYVRKYGAGGAE